MLIYFWQEQIIHKEVVSGFPCSLFASPVCVCMCVCVCVHACMHVFVCVCDAMYTGIYVCV